jgi:anti-sigma factor RsiW
MICKDKLENLSAYSDGELDAVQARALEEHLEGCPSCRKVLSQYEALGGILKSERDTEPTAGFLQGVRDRASGPAAPRPAGPRVIRTVAAIAASVLLLLGLIFVGASEFGHRERGEGGTTPAAQSGDAFTEVEAAVQEDPELLEILDNLEALEKIELLENLSLLERLEEFETGEADDLSKAAEVLIPEEEIPVEGGE